MQKRQVVTSGDYTIIQNEYGNVIIMKNGDIVKSLKIDKRLSEQELKNLKNLED